MTPKKFALLLLIVLIQVGSLTACQTSWQITVSDQSGNQIEIIAKDVNFYIEKSEEEITRVSLGQLFYHHGYTFIEEITFHSTNGRSKSFLWEEISQEALISQSGEIIIADEFFTPSEISLKTSAQLYKDYYSILDIAPTVAFALGLPNLSESQGQVRLTHAGDSDNVVMILLDGLQYNRLISLIKNGSLPFFEGLNMVPPGITVFPPITTSASGALLTGTPPKINGVYGYGYRSTAVKSIFDLAVEDGKKVIAVEGSSLPFNLRNAETILSGDKDNNGRSDDNVFNNSMQVIETKMPDLLYIHFHDIDDMGHKYGPESSEYATAIIAADTYLSQLVQALPTNTLIAIFADHGMHATANGGGNHGTLTAADLVIPIIFLEK